MDAGVSSQVSLKSTFEADVRQIVTAKHVRMAAANDAVAGVQPSFVVEPGSEQELGKVLKLANTAGLAVIPRGGGTKLEWGNPPVRADVILSTARLNRVLEHAWADLTVSVEAGCTIAKLQETLAKHGQRLALDALWPKNATVGGVLATNDSGALRLRFGSLRDLVIGVTVALAFGTLAVITRAIFRLHPLPKETRTISCVTSSAAEAQQLVHAIQSSKLAHSALQICWGAGIQPRVDVLFEGTEAGLAAQVQQAKTMMRAATIGDAARDVWDARQEICSAGKSSGEFAVAKFAILPAELAEPLETIARLCRGELRWSIVVQAAGIDSALRQLRANLEGRGGSLVLAHRTAGASDFDAWGNSGDVLPLLNAL